MYIGKADILMDHFNKCLFPKCLKALYEIGFKLTQRFLRCLKSAGDGACIYCKFTYRLKTSGYKSKGIGSRMTNSALFNILMKTFLHTSQHGTSSKTTKISLKNQ